MQRTMPTKFQNIDLMTTLSTRTNILTVIKTFALDIDTQGNGNEFNIVPSIGFPIYPRFIARSTDFASLRASSRINHSTKFVQKEPVSIEYVTPSLVI
jgi:hypothetical protein